MNKNNNQIMYNPNATITAKTNKLINYFIVGMGVSLPMTLAMYGWFVQMFYMLECVNTSNWILGLLSVTVIGLCFYFLKIKLNEIQYISTKSVKHAIRHTFRNLTIGILSFGFSLFICSYAFDLRFILSNIYEANVMGLTVLTLLILVQVSTINELLPYRVVTTIK